MEWFKHDTNAANDAKIKKLLIRHGAVGYAVYFHCLELIAGNVSRTNITFELEHDAEIIADDLRIRGDGSRSGADIVSEIMRTIVSLGLFEEDGGRIFFNPGSISLPKCPEGKTCGTIESDCSGIRRVVLHSIEGKLLREIRL